ARSSAPPPKAAAPASALQDFLIQFVVEQTGYPEEIVELEADLEADLGIDSIKKAQLFGELGERFELAADPDLSLDDFPTLRHVLAYLQAHVKDQPADKNQPADSAPAATPRRAAEPIPAVGVAILTAAAATTTATALLEPPAAPADNALEKFLVEFVVEQTG